MSGFRAEDFARLADPTVGAGSLDPLPCADDKPWCPDCFRDLNECPGHDDDPEALDIMHALVNALRALPGLHPVPISIVREINRCEDYLKRHAKEE